MSKILVSLTARMGSTRLPNKPAFDLAGKPAFIHVFERCQQFLPNADYYFLNTTYEALDDPLAFLAQAYRYEVFRGAVDATYDRMIELINYLDLDLDDIYIHLGVDSPLLIREQLPFAVEQLQATGRDLFYYETKKRTLGEALGGLEGNEYTVRGMRKFAEGRKRYVVKTQDAMWWDFYDLHPIICKMPERFQREWPWGPLALDFPSQVLQIKQVYDLLYKGVPIDIEDIYNLFLERPMLASLGGSNLPLSTRAVYPHGFKDTLVEELKRLANVKIVEWKG